MDISELFYSVQGEGKRTGVPSFFIRANHCNLRCKFPGGNYCDTSYTSWFASNEKGLGNLSIETIVNEYKKHNCRDIVITGGEPTLQAEDLKQLCIEIKKTDANPFITLETNGTIVSDFVDYVDLISVSPKLKTSVPFGTDEEIAHEKNRINIPALTEINNYHKEKITDVQWKFVVTSEDDVMEVLELQKKIRFYNSDVYLMPEGINEEQLKQKRLRTIELCKKYGFNYTDRIHILIWGNKRGV